MQRKEYNDSFNCYLLINHVRDATRAVLITLVTAIFSLTSCTSNATPTPELLPVVVQLGSPHQSLHAGFYVADQKGFYTDEGLSVTLVEGGIDTDLSSLILDGTAQFGIMGASALMLDRAEGYDVKAIATIFRRDPVVFYSLADSGIVRLEDFVGKRVQASSRLSPRLHAMLGYVNIDPDDITEISTGGLDDLINGDLDIASGLMTNSVLSARRAGYDVNVIYPDDYGVHFYSIILFTSDNLIADDPDLITRFLRATLQGWTYAIENPLEIGPMVQLYNPDADADLETESMIAYLPYVNTGEDHIGWILPEIWAGMEETMREQGELLKPLDVTSVYTTQFIDEIYGEK